MKVVIAGTRYKDPDNRIPFDDYTLLTKSIERSGYNITEVISGDAIGVDKMGERWAVTNNIKTTLMPVSSEEWNRLGKRAGPMRNKRMAEYCDAAIVIWDGKSPGTRNMVNEMIRLDKPYYIGLTRNTVEDFV